MGEEDIQRIQEVKTQIALTEDKLHALLPNMLPERERSQNRAGPKLEREILTKF
jgi:hypothetical protein